MTHNVTAREAGIDYSATDHLHNPDCHMCRLVSRLDPESTVLRFG